MNGRLLNKKLHNQLGFTLLELLVVIAVIGVLASLAVPRLQSQIQRARFVEVVNATGPFKIAVEACAQTNNGLAGCNAGANGIPAATAAASGSVASVNVAAGVITATSVAANFSAGATTYILTPALAGANTANGVTWAVNANSTCLGAALCSQ